MGSVDRSTVTQRSYHFGNIIRRGLKLCFRQGITIPRPSSASPSRYQRRSISDLILQPRTLKASNSRQQQPTPQPSLFPSVFLIKGKHLDSHTSVSVSHRQPSYLFRRVNLSLILLLHHPILPYPAPFSKSATSITKEPLSCPPLITCNSMFISHILSPLSRLSHARTWLRRKKRLPQQSTHDQISTYQNPNFYQPFQKDPHPLRPRPSGMKDTLSVLYLTREDERGLSASGLGKLPVEIRQEIWGYVLGRETNVIIVINSKLRAVPESPLSIQAQGCYEPNPFYQNDDLERYGATLRPKRPAILRTCRQVYIEAVELLYSGDEFVFMNGDVWRYFVSAIQPRRLDVIRHIRISLSEADWPVLFSSAEASSKDGKGKGEGEQNCQGKEKGRLCIPPISTYSSYQASHRQEWHQCWETIAGMQHLTSLHVSIRYTLSRLFNNADACYDLLLPLLHLRGIQDLKFKLELVDGESGIGRERKSVGFGDETKDLVKRIKQTGEVAEGYESGAGGGRKKRG